MAKHTFMVYERLGRRNARVLSVTLIILLAVGIHDQFTAVLGDNWILWWVITLCISLLWFYYAFLVRRASIRVHPQNLRLQGPIFGKNISYGRIYTVTAGKMGQHYEPDQLTQSERAIVKPFFNLTALFIELRSYPTSFRWRRLWFHRLLFGTHRMGLLCYIEDWMTLSREIETARSTRQSNIKEGYRVPRQTLVGQLLAEELEF